MDELPAPSQADRIALRWVKAYDGETQRNMETGLRWSLSFLGATLPPGTMDRAIEYRTDDTFVLDLSRVGFSREALDALRVITRRLKASEEYEVHGAIDLGRFLVLTLHASWHYYQITGAAPTLDAFLERHNFEADFTFPVLLSAVAHQSRMIRFQLPDSVGRIAFIAEESQDDITRPGYLIDGYEVIDVMANGQLRFAIYDVEGKLAAAAPVHSTQAGKPSKCLWCHETNLQRLYGPTPDVEGFLTGRQFSKLIDSANQRLFEYRESLHSELDFTRQLEHTESELLYITFMEPSVRRTAGEWKVSRSEVAGLLKGLPQHTHAEFPFLGELYDRRDVDGLAPYGTLPAPFSVREANAGEPNYFR